MTAHDPVAELQAAGFPVHTLSDGERAVLGGLSPAELTILVDIGRRLAGHEPDVQAHTEVMGGLFF